MKIFLLPGIILLILTAELKGQDRIVTLTGDTIDCSIRKVTKENILFELRLKNITTSGKIKLTDIQSYKISQTQESITKPLSDVKPSQNWRFDAGGGLGILTATSKEAENTLINSGVEKAKAHSYFKNLRTGSVGTVSITRMFNSAYGAGITWKIFDTSAMFESFFDPQDGSTLLFSTYSEHIITNFTGASLYWNQKLRGTDNLNIGAEYSIGIANYRNEAEYIGQYLLLTGKCLGLEAGLDLEYPVFKKLYLSAGISAFYASLRKIKISDGTNSSTVTLDKQNYENLTRIDFTLGIRIHL